MFIFGRNRKPSVDDAPHREPSSNTPAPQPASPPLVPVIKGAQRFETVLGSGTTIVGKLECEGNIRLDGKFTGTLEISGNVLVGEGAEIEADIFARNISIAGSVRGNVGGHKVQLLQTARVVGDITAQSLSTDEGARIEGKISMTMPPEDSASPTNDETQEEAAPAPIDELDPPTDEPKPLPRNTDGDMTTEAEQIEINTETKDKTTTAD